MARDLIRVGLNRLALAVLVLFATSIVAFLVPQLLGVDPSRSVLAARSPEREPDPAVIERIRVDLGLDRGPIVRYSLWLRAAAAGDLGRSYVSRAPVGPQLATAVGITATLVVVSLVAAVAIAVPAGTAAAARPGGVIDRAVAYGSAVGAAVPEYVLGPALVLAFALHLGVLPSSGWRGPAHLVLPATTLGASAACYFAQLTRAEVADALAHPSMVLAQAKGLSFGLAVVRHALPNALTSVVGLFGLWLVGLLGGAVVVEVIFAVPGLGRLLYDAVLATDIPVIQGAIVVLVAVAMVVSLVVDLVQRALDPRSRSG